MPFVVYGAAMSAFGPGQYNPDSPMIAAVEIAAVTLLPAIAIWIPHEAALTIGAILLLLPTFLAICLVFIFPPVGIVAVTPMILWYVSAFKYSKFLAEKPSASKSHSATIKDSEEY